MTTRAGRLRNLAWSVVAQLQKDEVAFNDVPRIFAELQCSKTDKAVIFTELDSYPGLYASDRRWHTKLRLCRNDPTHGPELFAVWSVTDNRPDMRVMGEFLDGLSKVRRERNLEYGVDMLRKCGVAFTEHNNGYHLIVRHEGNVVDYWPSTGRWRMRGGPCKGGGIRNLLATLHVAVPVT